MSKVPLIERYLLARWGLYTPGKIEDLIFLVQE